jgi:hypothetical protein
MEAKRISAIFLQIVIVALGVGVLAALLYEPHVEGVNANATSLYDIYFDDPFLAYIYISFIAVFVGLYSAFKLAGYVGRGNMCSPESVQALRRIKLCALSFAGLILAAVGFIVITMRGKDDIAGGVAIGLFLIVSSLVVAGVSAKLEQKAGKGIQV